MQSLLSLTGQGINQGIGVVNAVSPVQLPSPAAADVKTFIKHDAPQNTEKLPVRLVLCFDGTGDTAQGSFSAAKGMYDR